MMPEDRGQRLYEFFDSYPSLSLGEKLLAYPALMPPYPRFFEGQFSISSTQYYTAVQAILELQCEWPQEFLESRRAFFLCIHIAYNLALGRRPGGSHPLIVYSQHVWDDRAAKQLVEDFPQSKFVHTVRDPISSCDGVFHHHLSILAEQHMLLPCSALDMLAHKDRAHSGMESRTRTIRFEDLHSDTAATMRDLADWLGLTPRESLFNSTFHGVPYVVTRDGISWSGGRLQQIQRHSWHLSGKDRALLFALFHQNFLEWAYPCPKSFKYPIVRWIVFLSLVPLPLRMEVIAAREIFKRRIFPAIRHGDIWRAMKSVLVIGLCRLKIIRLLVPAFVQCSVDPPELLRVGLARHAMDGERAAT